MNPAEQPISPQPERPSFTTLGDGTIVLADGTKIKPGEGRSDRVVSLGNNTHYLNGEKIELSGGRQIREGGTATQKSKQQETEEKKQSLLMRWKNDFFGSNENNQIH